MNQSLFSVQMTEEKSYLHPPEQREAVCTQVDEVGEHATPEKATSSSHKYFFLYTTTYSPGCTMPALEITLILKLFLKEKS